MPAKKSTPLVVNKIFSFYPSDLEKLQALSELTGISRSQILRELISVAYVERVKQKKETPRFYGEEISKFDTII